MLENRLTAMHTMLQIALPHVFVWKFLILTIFWTPCLRTTLPKYKQPNAALTGLLNIYSLVDFLPIIVREEIMLAASQVMDKANGHVLGSGGERNMRNMIGSVMGGFGFEFE